MGPYGWDFQSAHSMVLTNSWAATSGNQGMRIDKVDGLGIHDSRIYWNNNEGIYITQNAKNVTITDSRINGNSRGSSGSKPGIYSHPSAQNVLISGNTIGQADGFGNSQSYGIQVGTGVSKGLLINGNMFTGNVSGSIQNGATGSNVLVNNNLTVTP
ncbi:hypothetical protein PA598K_00002 [Paenibacillus sp. 598K]|nr:hypothetical protein PA598K_00002 [Paenibacillus sp. 598K]